MKFEADSPRVLLWFLFVSGYFILADIVGVYSGEFIWWVKGFFH